MNLQLIWDNLVAYSLQIGLLVGLAAFVPAALRLRLPAVRLAYWQILLAACLLLPAVRPWKQVVLTLTTYVPTQIAAPVTRQPPVAPASIACGNCPLSARRGYAGPPCMAGLRLLASRAPAAPFAAASPRFLLGCGGRPSNLRRHFESGYLRLFASRRAPSGKFSRARAAGAGGHSVPRNHPRSASRLALHPGGRAGP